MDVTGVEIEVVSRFETQHAGREIGNQETRNSNLEASNYVDHHL